MVRRQMIPPFLSEMIRSAVILFDGVEFTEIPSQCSICASSLRRHDLKKKRFATLLDDEATRPVFVKVARYRCSGCGRLWYADEPFYPDTRHGAIIVDLATSISQKQPFHRTARILEALGIRIDRGTVRNYATRFSVHSTDMYGIPIPDRIIWLSGLIAKGGSIEGTELLAALRLPPADRTLPRSPPPEKEEGEE
ncbi:MAG: Uncharacterized protein XE11_0031 [Methanomicrobiales archaeon 53_19]|uniref:hypothetical protein n=1 Tax=Methanocalculus sp. TaxID=2004547 RepID=UPI000748487E|nr:hypothetical protein [Methanocalculus sp.]KUK70925.1 MAG: Uncharacterized protein XD88_0363 [Methanocalculus sp. 52_23]KUL05169.1 MAG: Uncharacterized protein XE11_0031 [Methanomicrobiales archaeon 53_19]HIJ05826.1 hypothetical protein [Methanocalculus sp.]